MSRKPRSDSKLKLLPDEVQETLWRLLNTPVDEEGRPAPVKEGGKPMRMEDALAWLRDTHSVDSSLGALSDWYSWYGLRQRTERARARAEQATLEFARENPEVDSTDLERLGQMVFTAETIEGGDIKAYVALMNLRLKQKDQELDERRVALLEEKARQRDAAKDVLGSELSQEEQNRLLREILK